MGNIIQFCGFKVGENEFALEVGDIREIINPLPITKVPLADETVEGLLNLRGQIVTCLNFRKILGLKSLSIDRKSACMNVIVRHRGDLYGLTVDEVTDIVAVGQDDLIAPPANLSPELRNLIVNVYKKKSDLTLLLSTERFFNSLNLFKNLADEKIHLSNDTTVKSA